MNNQMTIEQLEELMTSKEGEHLEFKEAKKSFHFNTLVEYCAAMANEGGGKFVFGVTDKRPRSVVGSQAFKQPERTRFGLIEQLHLNIFSAAGISKWLMKRAPTRVKKGWIVKQTRPCS